MLNPDKAQLPELIDAWVRMQRQATTDAEYAESATRQARRSADQAKTLHDAIRGRLRDLGEEACTHGNHVYQLHCGQLHVTRAADARHLEHPNELALDAEQHEPGIRA